MGNAGPLVVNGVASFRDIGSATVLPESGYSGLAFANNNLVKVAPNGAQSPVGGGGATDYGRAMFAVANAANPLITQYTLYELDMPSGTGWSSQISGAGAAVAQSTTIGSVVTLASGTAASGVAVVQPPGTTGAAAVVANMKTDIPWFVGGRIRIDGTLDAQTFCMIAMGAPNLTAFLGIGYDGTVNAGKFSISNINAALASLEGHALVDNIQSINFIDVGIYCDGTICTPYIGDVIAATFAAQPASNLVTTASFPTGNGIPLGIIDNRTTAGTSRIAQVASLFYARAKVV